MQVTKVCIIVILLLFFSIVNISNNVSAIGSGIAPASRHIKINSGGSLEMWYGGYAIDGGSTNSVHISIRLYDTNLNPSWFNISIIGLGTYGGGGNGTITYDSISKGTMNPIITLCYTYHRNVLHLQSVKYFLCNTNLSFTTIYQN